MQNCLMRYADQALYYPSSAKKIGQFFSPSTPIPYGALVLNFFVNFCEGTPFSQKKKTKKKKERFFLIIIFKGFF